MQVTKQRSRRILWRSNRNSMMKPFRPLPDRKSPDLITDLVLDQPEIIGHQLEREKHSDETVPKPRFIKQGSTDEEEGENNRNIPRHGVDEVGTHRKQNADPHQYV